jgi:hypothetical protein
MATEKALGVARLFRIAEERAQSLADETGKVAYLTTNGTQITIDREIAKRWPDMVAIMPKVVARSMERIVGEVRDDALARLADAHHLGGNLGMLAKLTVTEVPKIPTLDGKEPHVRVIRILEYRGPKSWIETNLATAYISQTEPKSGVAPNGEHWEIVEQIRTPEPLGAFDE